MFDRLKKEPCFSRVSEAGFWLCVSIVIVPLLYCTANLLHFSSGGKVIKVKAEILCVDIHRSFCLVCLDLGAKLL